jgi:hypothetical protein
VCRDLLERFERWATAYGIVSLRLELALNRAWEPLLEQAPSAFVERSWRDLSDRELRQFVRHGLRREEILLRREPDWIRFRTAVHQARGAGGPRRAT